MNEIAFACPHCSRTLKVPPQYGGMESDCPGCGNPLRIPTREELIAHNIANRGVPQTQVVEKHPEAPAPGADDTGDAGAEKTEAPARDYQQREQTGKPEGDAPGRTASRDRKGRGASNASADMASALNALNKHEAAWAAAQKAKAAKDGDKKNAAEPSPTDAVDALERCINTRDLGAAEVVARALASSDHRVVRAGIAGGFALGDMGRATLVNWVLRNDTRFDSVLQIAEARRAPADTATLIEVSLDAGVTEQIAIEMVPFLGRNSDDQTGLDALQHLSDRFPHLMCLIRAARHEIEARSEATTHAVGGHGGATHGGGGRQMPQFGGAAVLTILAVAAVAWKFLG